MDPKCGGNIHTPIKSPKDSSLTNNESEYLSFRVSKLEYLIKGSMRMIDLVNVENNMEERMGHMESNMMGHMDINTK